MSNLKELVERKNELKNELKEIKNNTIKLFTNSCKINDIEEVKYAINNNIFDKYEILDGLHKACEKGNIEIIKFLSEKNVHNFLGILSTACMNKQYKIIKFLMKKYDYLQNKQNYDIAFEDACESGDWKMINLFIKKGVNNFEDGAIGACEARYMRKKQYNIFKFCVINGAKDWNEMFKIACRGGNMKIIKFLLKKDIYRAYFFEGLKYACAGNQIRVIKLLIKLGVNNFNDALKNSFHPIKIKILKLLIKHHARILDNDMTRIYLYLNIQITKLLLEIGLEYNDNIIKKAYEQEEKKLINYLIKLECKKNYLTRTHVILKYDRTLKNKNEKIIKIKGINNKNIKKVIKKYI